ncbi:hypothetical protein FPV67DRAFT_1669786 [Lyophyllum atratum]|nr:hypothetical protein FPV67DRAFT_1669786 [Lyophyllum atratum]
MSSKLSTSSCVPDLEQGVTRQQPTVTGDAAAELRELQTELHAFLAAYTIRLSGLREACPPPRTPAATNRPLSDVTDDTIYDVSSPSDSVPKSPPAARGEQADVHVRHLKDFLNSHLQGIEHLQNALSSTPHKKYMTREMKLLKVKEDAAFEALVSQFNMLVVISTFTASLIISFLSLVKSITADTHPVAFDIGMLLSFFAMSTHFGNIIVAGRGSALAAQHPADTAGTRHDLKYFRHYLQICEQLQFCATVVFLVSVVQLTFFVFHRITYPLVLLGVSMVGSLVVFWSAYWQVSMTLRNLKLVVKGFHFLRIRVREKPLFRGVRSS